MQLSPYSETCKQAIAKFGKEKQLDMAIEELAELTKAIVKYRRHNWNAVWRIKVMNEVADCEIMMVQLRMMLSDDGEYQRILENKLANLRRIIENDDPMRGIEVKK